MIMKTPEILSSRNIRIIQMHLERFNNSEISRKVGITPERVRQILQRAGYKPQKLCNIKRFTPRNRGLTSRQAFWGSVDIGEEGECWEWQGRRSRSLYGCYQLFKGYEVYAHRIAYLFTHGKKAKKWVLHSCDNPPCCNPNHLRDGTPQDNVRDREERARYTRRGPVLNLGQARAIRRLVLTGRTDKELARKFNVSELAISKIRLNKTWKSNNFLSDSQVRDIRRRKASGETGKRIAADYNLCIDTIYRISRREQYKHVQ